MKIPLSIDENYCVDWGVYEGVREFAQNGRDAMRDGHVFDMVYLESKKCLTVTTTGVTLPHEALLLGNSTKRDRSDTLGRHGEGLKTGSLALIRLGKKIRIRTADELWQPAIVRSDKFNANVLTFDITGGKSHRNEISVEIHGVTKEEWDSISWKFLFVGDHSFDLQHTKSGTVIIGGLGKIFVDGIYICDNSDFIHGYDLPVSEVSLDRDRRLVDTWSTRNLTAKIWEKLYLEDKYVNAVDEMLANDRPDVRHFKYDYITSDLARKKVSSQFVKKHGEDAIPVETVADITALSFYGKSGKIVASESLRAILNREIGSVESVKSEKRQHILSSHNLDSLSDNATKNLLAGLKIVSEATGIMLPFDIVTFSNPETVGMFQSGKISLSKTILESFPETLKTIVEEVAHLSDADGTRNFQEALHDVYAKIIMNQMGYTEKRPQAPLGTYDF